MNTNLSRAGLAITFLFCAMKQTTEFDFDSGHVGLKYDSGVIFKGEKVMAIKAFRTMETIPLDIDDDDLTLLTEEKGEDGRRAEAHAKFHGKIQALKCVNGLLTKVILNDLKIITKTKGGGRQSEVVEKYVHYICRMLSVFYYVGIPVYGWQIAVYVMLGATLDGKVQMEKGSLLDNSNVANEIKGFVNKCRENRYLQSLDGQSDEADIYKSARRLLVEYVELEETGDCYKHLKLFTVPNLALSGIFGRYDVIFRSSTLLLDWTPAIKFLNRFRIDNVAEWALTQYRVDHHVIFKTVVYAKIFYHSLVHLMNYQQVRLNFIFPIRIRYLWELLLNPLKCAYDLLKFDFRGVTATLLRNLINSQKEHTILSLPELSCLVENTVKLVERFLTTLHIAGVADIINNAIPRYIMGINDFFIYQHLMMSNAEELDLYVKDISQILEPIDFDFISFVINSIQNASFYTLLPNNPNNPEN